MPNTWLTQYMHLLHQIPQPQNKIWSVLGTSLIFLQTNTTLFTIIPVIKWFKFHLSSTIIGRFSLLNYAQSFSLGTVRSPWVRAWVPTLVTWLSVHTLAKAYLLHRMIIIHKWWGFQQVSTPVWMLFCIFCNLYYFSNMMVNQEDMNDQE